MKQHATQIKQMQHKQHKYKHVQTTTTKHKEMQTNKNPNLHKCITNATQYRTM